MGVSISIMESLNVLMSIGLFIVTLITLRDWQFVLALVPGSCPIITTDKQADIEMDLRSESCREYRASIRPKVEEGEDNTHIELDELGWLFQRRAFGFIWILTHLITTHMHYFLFMMIFSGLLDNTPVNAILLLVSACSLVLWCMGLVWMRRKAIVESVKQINPCRIFPVPLIETFTIPTVAIILACVFNLVKSLELDSNSTKQFKGRFRLGISYGLYFEYLVLLLGAMDRIYKMRSSFLREKPPTPKRHGSYLDSHLSLPAARTSSMGLRGSTSLRSNKSSKHFSQDDSPGNVRPFYSEPGTFATQGSNKDIVVNMGEATKGDTSDDGVDKFEAPPPEYDDNEPSNLPQAQFQEEAEGDAEKRNSNHKVTASAPQAPAESEENVPGQAPKNDLEGMWNEAPSHRSSQTSDDAIKVPVDRATEAKPEGQEKEEPAPGSPAPARQSFIA